jgi:hypothetical protein
MSKIFIYHYIPNIWDKDELDVEDAYEFESNRDIFATDEENYDGWELEWLVEEMADDYVSNHDGWEVANSWCGTYRDFAVWDANKKFIGKFEVLLEYEPTFRATRKK